MPDSELLTGDVTVDDGVFLYGKNNFFYTPRHGDAFCRKFIKRKEVGQNANPSQGKTNKPQA